MKVCLDCLTGKPSCYPKLIRQLVHMGLIFLRVLPSLRIGNTYDFVIEATLRYLKSRAPTFFLSLIKLDDRMYVYVCGRTMM
jgi:hypothetical protein